MIARLLAIYARGDPRAMGKRMVDKMEADMALAERKAIAFEKCLQELIMPCFETMPSDEKELAVEALERQVMEAVDALLHELWDILQRAGGVRQPRKQEQVDAVSVEATFRASTVREMKSLQEYVPTEEEKEEAKAKRIWLEERQAERRVQLMEEKKMKQEMKHIQDEEAEKKKADVKTLLEGLRDSAEKPESAPTKKMARKANVEDGPQVLWWAQDGATEETAKQRRLIKSAEMEAETLARLEQAERSKLKPLQKASERTRHRGRLGQGVTVEMLPDALQGASGLQSLSPNAAFGPATNSEMQGLAEIKKSARGGGRPTFVKQWAAVEKRPTRAESPLQKSISTMRTPSPE